MNYSIIRKVPSMEDLRQEYPLSEENKLQIAQDRKEIQAIIEGKDPRLLMLVGPCSAWPKQAVLEYAAKLLKVSEALKHSLKIIMRVYIQKPRTIKGWAGPLTQPIPFEEENIALGLRYTREMMVNIISMGLPIADEALYIQQAKGFLELLSWLAIGARSSENQEHRIFASALDFPVGLKNPTHGALMIGVNSVIAAQHSHVTLWDGYEIKTAGNPYAHLVLRGSNQKPNYSIKHLQQVKNYMANNGVVNPSVLIDASHDNCIIKGKKDHHQQIQVVLNTVKNLKNKPELKKLVKGFMLESFLQEGHQPLSSTKKDFNFQGLSITDPCLGWEDTERLLFELANNLSC